MNTLIIPGRHLLQTKFQQNCLEYLLSKENILLPILNKQNFAGGKIDRIIFAITSANQSGSRYNPIPLSKRVIALDRFAKKVTQSSGAQYEILEIPHYDASPKYAEILMKEIEEELGENFSPKDTLIFSSTKELFEQFVDLGYGILTAEYDPRTDEIAHYRPLEIVQMITEAGEEYASNKQLTNLLSDTAGEFFRDHPRVIEKLLWLWRDPLLTDDGSLTETRNYSVYSTGMNDAAMLNIKYNDIKAALKHGRIVDEGCADGALLTYVAKDFPDADLIGIDISAEFLARCAERQRSREYGGSFIHFHQRNLLEKIFADASIDCTICNSTTHEVWSYGDGEQSLMDYLSKKFAQTKPGGRIIIRDVVGTDKKDETVYMQLSRTDGSNENIFFNPDSNEELAAHLSLLSTEARFQRFTEDFLSDMRASGRRGPESKIQYKFVTIEREKYIKLRYKDAVEFMTKKDYLQNWRSEMNEEFAFWGYSDWRNAIKSAGFKIVDTIGEDPISHSYTSEWIVKNRWEGKVKLFHIGALSGKIESLKYPPTNMVIVGEK